MSASPQGTPPQQQTGVGAKIAMGFIAGAMLGAFAMVEVVPTHLATDGGGGGGGGPLVIGGGGNGDLGEEDLQALEEQGVDLGQFEGADMGDFEAGEVGEARDLSGNGGGSGGADATGSGGGSDSGDDGGSSGGGSGGSGGAGADVGGSSGSGGAGGTGSGGTVGDDSCASNNGGETDTGVTARQIKVAATTVEDGPGRSLLQPANDGMRAVIDKINAKGGICGRTIELTTRNDGWDAARGRNYIERFIEEGHFSLLVVPSSEGLAEAIQSNLISNAEIPVVGTTGLRIDEYKDPWVFPVSTATVSIMRIMAKHAIDQGAETFGIVYDEQYRFGIEGKDAFVEYIESQSGAEMKAVQAVHPEQAPYGSEANTFNSDCGNSGGSSGCDMVALLLVPDVAIQWRNANSDGDVQGRGKTTYGAQTLFTDEFATQCGDWCNGMVVWTGYNPPIGTIADQPGVKQFENDVEKVNPGADTRNQFLQGAYLGTQVFVEAVDRCSPDVTRACVRQTLNSINYESDLASTLSWSENQRHANTAARAFSMEASGGSFNGWRDERTGFVQDPGL